MMLLICKMETPGTSCFLVILYKGGIELVFHTENSMKYQSLHTILKYRFNIPFQYEIPIFCTWKIKFGMLKRYLRIVCKDWYFILFSVWNTNSIPPGKPYAIIQYQVWLWIKCLKALQIYSIIKYAIIIDDNTST
jgi:hypothetical protein